mmetsp:Transcript_4494/g.14736  ORF Transcript_4494/g.14736 Transcript_4494/m.14736 type:complete len:268 (+) Transcript_4494:517-1320(+)
MSRAAGPLLTAPMRPTASATVAACHSTSCSTPTRTRAGRRTSRRLARTGCRLRWGRRRRACCVRTVSPPPSVRLGSFYATWSCTTTAGRRRPRHLRSRCTWTKARCRGARGLRAPACRDQSCIRHCKTATSPSCVRAILSSFGSTAQSTHTMARSARQCTQSSLTRPPTTTLSRGAASPCVNKWSGPCLRYTKLYTKLSAVAAPATTGSSAIKKSRLRQPFRHRLLPAPGSRLDSDFSEQQQLRTVCSLAAAARQAAVYACIIACKY